MPSLDHLMRCVEEVAALKHTNMNRAAWTTAETKMLVEEIKRLRGVISVIPQEAWDTRWVDRVIGYLDDQQKYDDANAFALLDEIGFFPSEKVECDWCHGTGEVEFQRECKMCGGQGVVSRE